MRSTNLFSMMAVLVVLTGCGAAKTVTVTQAAPTVSLNAETASVRASETLYELEVTSNASWTATVEQGGEDVWLEAPTRAGDNQMVSWFGNGTVKIHFDENSGASRIIKVKVSAGANVSKTLTLTQKGEPVTKELRISDLYISNYAGSQSMDNVTVAFTNTQKTGGNLTLGYRANSNPKNRQATIKITPNTGTTITKMVITFQNNTDAGYAVGTEYKAPEGWTYSSNANNKVTWTGESSSEITFTIGHSGNTGWPVATGLSVTYE